MSNLPKIENGVIVESGSSIKELILEGLRVLWDITEKIAYWVCAIGGVFYLIVFIVSKDNRFKTKAIVCVLLYLLIRIIGYATDNPIQLP
jgi:hypothetical protein